MAARGITQEELAEMLETDQSVISYYVNTKRKLRRKTVAAIASKLHIEVDELTGDRVAKVKERDPRFSVAESILGNGALRAMQDLKQRYKTKPETRQQIEHMLHALHGSDAKALIEWLKE